MDRLEQRKILNRCMYIIDISTPKMPDFIFDYYVRNINSYREKPFYNLLADSFLTLRSFCILMNNNCWSQASTVLRMGLEQVSKIFLLAEHPELREVFYSLYEERGNFVKLSNEEQKKYRKTHGIKGKTENYFDYSWFKKLCDKEEYGRNQLLKLARLNEFQQDIEDFLDSFAHGSITIFQFNKDNWQVMKDYGDRICKICCKLYDFLCYSLFRIIGETIEYSPIYETHMEFKTLYLSLFPKKE